MKICKFKNYSVLIATFAIFLTAVSQLSAGIFQNEIDLAANREKGGVEKNVFKTSAIIIDYAYRDDAVFSQGQPSIGIGAGLWGYYSEYYSFLNLPLSYSLQKLTGFDLKLNINIPYSLKSAEIIGRSYSITGLGDISAGAAYQLKAGALNIILDLAASLPTGDSHETDRGIYLPSGSGGYSAATKLALSFSLTKLRIFASSGAVYYFESETWATFEQKDDIITNTGPATSTVTKDYGIMEQNGVAVTAVLGAEYKIIEKLSLLAKLNYIKLNEGKRKYEEPVYHKTTGDLIGAEWTGWNNKNDALDIGDAILGVKFLITPNIGVNLYGNYPVFGFYQSSGVADRNFGIHLGVDSLF